MEVPPADDSAHDVTRTPITNRSSAFNRTNDTEWALNNQNGVQHSYLICSNLSGRCRGGVRQLTAMTKLRIRDHGDNFLDLTTSLQFASILIAIFEFLSF